MTATLSNQYTCLYTISLSPNTGEEAFERVVIDDIIPNKGPHLGARRTTQHQHFEHRLLKAIGKHGDSQYVWQIRVLDYTLVGKVSPDYEDYDRLFGAMEVDVRQVLAPWGNVNSTANFQEIGPAPPSFSPFSEEVDYGGHK